MWQRNLQCICTFRAAQEKQRLTSQVTVSPGSQAARLFRLKNQHEFNRKSQNKLMWGCVRAAGSMAWPTKDAGLARFLDDCDVAELRVASREWREAIDATLTRLRPLYVPCPLWSSRWVGVSLLRSIVPCLAPIKQHHTILHLLLHPGCFLGSSHCSWTTAS